MIRKAVIVAAGLSSRLYPLTSDTPKALLPIGNETMLARSMRLLSEQGVTDIAVVVGYRADVMRTTIGDAATVISNPYYRHCNNMGSLLMAKAFAGHAPFAYLHGDLVYEGPMFANFLRKSAVQGQSCLDLLTAFGPVDDEAMKVRTTDDGHLVESNKSIPLDKAAGEWTGIAIVQRPDIVFEAIEKHMMDVSLEDYDTAAFTSLAAAGNVVRCIAATDDPWKEIDTMEDLNAARADFGAKR
jgi:choline kinase